MVHVYLTTHVHIVNDMHQCGLLSGPHWRLTWIIVGQTLKLHHCPSINHVQ